MAQVPILRPGEVVRVFQSFGWGIARQRGSHIIMTKPTNIATLSIPDHPQVARGTPRALIGRAGLTVDEFLSALK